MRAIAALLLTPTTACAMVWQIGPGQTYTLPSQVSDLVSDGDTVDIQAGVYQAMSRAGRRMTSSCAVWVVSHTWNRTG